MSRWLLDTSVVSALAPDKPEPPTAFAAWLRANADDLYLPAVAVAEIEQGLRRLRRAGGTTRAERLADWLTGLLNLFGDRVIVVDAVVARAAGALSDAAIARGRHPGLADILIAATAQVHDLTVATRNGRHFERLGVQIIDPFETARRPSMPGL